jgi:hypothetical protein
VLRFLEISSRPFCWRAEPSIIPSVLALSDFCVGFRRNREASWAF